MPERQEGLRERSAGLVLAGLGLIVVVGTALLALFTLTLSGWIPEDRSFADVVPGYAIAMALGLLTLGAGVWVYRRNRR